MRRRITCCWSAQSKPMKAAISRSELMIFLPCRSLDNTRAGGGGTLIVSPRRTTSENALSLQQTSGSKVSPKSSHGRGRVFVTGRCGCHSHGRTQQPLGPRVSIESTSPRKKEGAKKKERLLLPLTRLFLSTAASLVPIRGQSTCRLWEKANRATSRLS